MSRHQMLRDLAERILRIERPHPTRVAIDGIDAAGKTTLADELVAFVQRSGRSVIRASIDGFHYPLRLRYRRGPLSPEGYYDDSLNTDAVKAALLLPLGPNGAGLYRTAVFDADTDSPVVQAEQHAPTDAVLLFDGVFLLRPELRPYWDFVIFVDVDFAIAEQRAAQRDLRRFGSVETIQMRYRQRYVPGQRLYFQECEPKRLANVIVHNNDPANATLTRQKASHRTARTGEIRRRN